MNPPADFYWSFSFPVDFKPYVPAEMTSLPSTSAFACVNFNSLTADGTTKSGIHHPPFSFLKEPQKTQKN